MPRPVFLLFVAAILFASGCRKNSHPDEFTPADSLGMTNKWIIDSMRAFYYWSDLLPPSPDYSQPSYLFFKSLLSPEDRFSEMIYLPEPAPVKSSFYKFGFHFAFVKVDGYDHYMGVLTFIMANSPASLLEWKRGMCFTKVDGEVITDANLAAVTRYMNTEATRLELTLARLEGGVWQEQGAEPIRMNWFSESALYYKRIFTGGGRTTGYLFYNHFDEFFDRDMLDAFGRMKAAGVSELIVDLRYNMGGSVASAAKMVAMIARNLQENDIYAIYEGNKRMGKRGYTLREVLSTSGAAAGRTHASLQEKTLSLNRVFILTTKATASAAEMVINNLRPYIPVIQIGEATTGKDEASFEVVDTRQPRKINWEIHPIVYKLFNKNGEGHYSDGLNPDKVVSELSTFPLQPVGNVSDPLLHSALEMIYGSNIPGAPTDLRIRKINVTPVFNSAVQQAGQMPPATVHY